MNRRGFVGTIVAVIGGLFYFPYFPRKVRASVKDSVTGSVGKLTSHEPSRILTDCMRDSNGKLRKNQGFVAYWDSKNSNVLFSREFPPKAYPIKLTCDELHLVLSEIDRCKT